MARPIRKGPRNRRPFIRPISVDDALLPTGSAPFGNSNHPNPVLRASFFATCLGLSACLGTPNVLPQREVIVQREWAGTRITAPPRQQPSYPQNLLTSTLSTVAAPFYLRHQPNPGLRARTVQPDVPANIIPLISVMVLRAGYGTRTWALPRQQPDLTPNLLSAELAPLAAPFEQTDWPNPVLARKVQQPFQLSSFVAFTPNPIPEFNNDFPNPVLRVRTVQPEIPPNLTGGLLPPFTQANWPNPVLALKVQQPFQLSDFVGFTPNPIPFFNYDLSNAVLRTRTVQPEAPPNLLVNTLTSVAAPFSETDWPNPVLARKVQQPLQLSSYVAFTPNPIPAFNYNQPNPILRIRTVQPEVPANFLPLNEVIVLREWAGSRVWGLPRQQPFDPPNVLITVPAVTGTPFSQGNWPNPLIKSRTVQIDRSFNLLINAPVLGTPFYQVNWSNPAFRTWTLTCDVFSAPPQEPPAITPFNQEDWPNPILRVRAVYRDTSSVFPPLYPNPIPFNLDHQPNPNLRVRTVQPEIPVDLIPLQTTPPTVETIRRIGLSTRIWAKRFQPTDIPTNYLPARYFVPPTKPFNQSTWPTNRRPWNFASQVFDTTRYDTELFPFSQDNWPNPVIKVRKGYLQDYTNRVTLIALQVAQRRPLTVPILRLRTVQPEIPINIRPLTGPPVVPATQRMWPNPAPKPRTVQPELPLNYALSHTAPIPPFYLRNQPNPTLSVSRFGYWVFQFDRLNLSLQPAVWGNINDAQTPGWNATGDPCTVDSTIGTADTTLYTADMDCSATWGTIDDSDTPGWTPIVDSQTPAWSAVDDSENPGWTPVITDPGGSSSS